MKELLKKYASLEIVFRKYEEQREELRKDILEAFRENHVEKEETDYASFSVGRRSSYTFSPAVKKLEDKVKIMKDKEIKSGKAAGKTTAYLVFKLKENK